MYSVIDSVCDQPIFFLISQAEDFTDFSRRKRSEDRLEAENKMKNLSIEKSLDDNDQVVEGSPKKPFTFADFAELTADDTTCEETKAQDVERKEEDDVVAGESNNSDEKSTPADDDVESVYMMASSRSIDGVVEEYVKRKKSCSMLPSSGSNFPKKVYGGSGSAGTTIGNVEPLPPEIEQQRKSSIHKVRVYKCTKTCWLPKCASVPRLAVK